MQPSCHHLSGSKPQSPDPGKHNDISVGISAMDGICKCSTYVSAIVAHVALSAVLNHGYPPGTSPPFSIYSTSPPFSIYIHVCLHVCPSVFAAPPPPTHTHTLSFAAPLHAYTLSLCTSLVFLCTASSY